MENLEIARMLSETADLMEIGGEDGFRIRSYRNAASVIEGYPERIAEIVKDASRKVTDIQGIGKGIAEALKEIVTRGSFARRDEMLEKYPPTALEMLRIQGLGPKSVRTLWEHFRVSTLEDLERLCREHKLQELPRMGAKLEDKILKGISQYRQSAGRFLMNYATAAAEELGEYLGATPAGSLRRGRETVGDLDLLVTGENAEAALAKFVKHPRVHDILGQGTTKASARFGLEGLQVDVRAVPAESYGAAMQYFTGSKEHNVALRQRAQKMGLTLNEYGLFKVSDETRVAGATEEEIYEALGLAWIPPEMRENQGEIEAAEKRQLPDLIELSDLRGDLHMHTRESDGRATMEEMAESAKALGYEYIAITDHSKALAMANGLDEARAVQFAAQVREFNKEDRGIRIFSGLECDILRDGRMDLSEEALAELDWVVASVHGYMNIETAEMTDRLLRAMESPSVKVLGHPTGRVLLHREAYTYDFDRVAADAAKRGVWMEVNASPERLDLSASLLRRAKALGVKFTISTDAHHPKHLANMKYGVKMARRGWLTKEDVMNTRGVAHFASAVRK
ncbi:DNA polymerase/3'-5' exonuclease PolX [uncultured Paludibaculum sp.]|uniref:DNA polymerase/3'-5' exonuclease PolX n=1 Tax=uncultured Paludibaculum sp. TaxID=1765020 RepID=UPI002AAB78F0|nr:DNA polymerase/3'-5' exonuclease PolX [uncultured Paludibaculum sp.]